jgi:hypothetical protein
MKTLLKISSLLMFTSILFIACQKETSFEKGSSTASVGSLATDASGNCLGAVISGTYYKDTTLKASNYVDVTVQVDTVGTYSVSTDTVNGYYFKASGTFSATGTQTVRLVGGGKPLATGSNIFTVTYNGTVCEFTVLVTAPAGGSSAFTISCTGATPAGTYVVNTALSASNTITLNVNVTAIGSWSVTTAPAVNGMIFSGTGTFTTTGTGQTITLTGSGTPAAAGTFTFTVTGGTGTCTFQATITAVANPDYFPRTAFSNWSYQFDGDPADSLLIYSISPTKTINGNTYNIFFYNDGQGVDSFGYYRRSGGDYLEWINMGAYVGLDDDLWMEWTFLKDNLTAGGTWTSAQFSGPFTDPNLGTINVTLRWEFTITQQNVNFTVGSTNYANVIQVKQELKQLVGTSWVLAAWFDSYYARDKGLIKQDLYDDSNTIVYEQDVRRLVVY